MAQDYFAEHFGGGEATQVKNEQKDYFSQHFGQQESEIQSPSDSLPETYVPDFKSPINLAQRLRISFADERGKESELRNKFQFVSKSPDGKYLVGNSQEDATPLDSDSFFVDTISHIANQAGQIPAIAGQIAGATLGSGAGPGGAIAGSALGAAAGEGVKQTIGKALGVNQQTAEEMATDRVLGGLFGAAGESIGLGLKSVIGKSMAWKAIEKGVESSANPSFSTKQVAAAFKLLGGREPEVTTRILSDWGSEVAHSPTYTGNKYPAKLASDFVENVVERRRDLGLEVKAGNQWFKANYGGGEFTQQRGVSDVLDNFITGIHDNNINPLGAGIKSDVAGVHPTDNAQLKNIVNIFFKGVENEDGLIKWKPREMSNAQALEAYDNLDSQLRGFWRNREVSVDKRLQQVTAEFKNGIRKSLGDITLRAEDKVMGPNGEMVIKPEILAKNDFLRSRANFAKFAQGSEILADNGGPDLTNVTDLKRNVIDKQFISKSTEDFFANYPDRSESSKIAFQNLNGQLPELHNFTNKHGAKITLPEELLKYHDVQHLMKSNPSLMRIGLAAGLMMLPGWPLLKLATYEAMSSPQTVMKGITLIKNLGKATENSSLRAGVKGALRVGGAIISQNMAQGYRQQ